MKINIYEINSDTQLRGNIVAELTYLNRNLSVKTNFTALDDLVNAVYKMCRNGSMKKAHYKEDKPHNLNTPDFVEKLGFECWKKGYMIEIEE